MAPGLMGSRQRVGIMCEGKLTSVGGRTNSLMGREHCKARGYSYSYSDRHNIYTTLDLLELYQVFMSSAGGRRFVGKPHLDLMENALMKIL